jgi:carbonic anhydrase/acetyltransferase-like protein (isoleucine patch superfamily)
MKYKLTTNTKEYLNTTLYQIQALKDFGNVKAGDLGGYIEKESNLSQEGDAWVHGNAQVFGNAQVYGNTRVYGNAQVHGNAQVYGNAQVHGNTRVYGNAWVYGNAIVYGSARVYGNAWVYGNAQVHGNAQVFGDAQVQKTPITIQGLKHNITITETHIFIGCEGHTIEHWRKNIVDIGIKNGYTMEEINYTIGILKSVLKREHK